LYLCDEAFKLMRLGTSGIVINELGEILLIQRDDTRTFAPPGGGIESGELPTENVVREVEEETGLKVMPVRLVGVYFLEWGDSAWLNFVFRCIKRGGDLTTSPESIQVGYFQTNNLPSPMAAIHRERLLQGFSHNGGAPYWQKEKQGLYLRFGRFLLNQGIYRWKNWQRKRRGEPDYVAPPEWRTGAFTVIRNEKGEVLWIKRVDMDFWNLPGGGGFKNEAPWETAVRETLEETGLTVTLTNLTSVSIYEDEPHAIFTFTAAIDSGTLTTGPEAEAFAWFAPGEEPDNCFASHMVRVADAVSADEVTQFRYQKIKRGNTEDTE
jgi:ADP-ribose pyrophosphatase YjhB (NUDIX family)